MEKKVAYSNKQHWGEMPRSQSPVTRAVGARSRAGIKHPGEREVHEISNTCAYHVEEPEFC